MSPLLLAAISYRTGAFGRFVQNAFRSHSVRIAERAPVDARDDHNKDNVTPGVHENYLPILKGQIGDEANKKVAHPGTRTLWEQTTTSKL